MKFLFTIGLLLILSSLHAQKCDCVYPYQPNPPCVDTCLKRAGKEVLYSVLILRADLPEPTARKFVTWAFSNPHGLPPTAFMTPEDISVFHAAFVRYKEHLDRKLPTDFSGNDGFIGWGMDGENENLH